MRGRGHPTSVSAVSVAQMLLRATEDSGPARAQEARSRRDEWGREGMTPKARHCPQTLEGEEVHTPGKLPKLQQGRGTPEDSLFEN